jgi:hypothetical protein
MFDDERAVSEIIGFVMIFALILGTVSMIYIAGLDGLGNTRDAERTQNAERAFDVLADNIQEIGRNEAPSRATEIKLADAQLRFDRERRQTIYEGGTADPSNTLASVNRSQAIVYDPGGDTEIVYEMGAVIRVDGDSSTMQRQPDFVFGKDHTVLRYLETIGSGSIGGQTTTLIQASETTTDLLYSEDATTEITVRFRTHPNRVGAWERYLEAETPDDDCETSISGDQATIDCTYQTDSLHVAVTQVRISFT